jgi:ribonuclease D
MAANLGQQPRLAVDTESNSLHAYQERVCLIQFSIPGTDFLVDPLALPDLSPLAPLFASESIEKIFHAAEYDLMCLKRDFGYTIAGLFDTRVASRTLGHPQDGLGDLLAQSFGIKLNKRFQRADWGQRPLPSKLLDYARLDTHYLLPLRDRLDQALRDSGRWEEAREEFARLEKTEAHTNGFDPQGYWRIANARQLSPEQAGALHALYQLREDLARTTDRPPFKVLGDRTLLALAEALPEAPEALVGLPGMTPSQVRRHGRKIVQAVGLGRQDPRRRPPPAQRMDEAILDRYEALRTWRKKVAEGRRVESDVILPKDVVWEIARVAPRDSEALWMVMKPLRWRFEAYGRDILGILWG